MEAAAGRGEKQCTSAKLGGIGPAATHVYYDAILSSFATTGLKLELTIAHTDLREMIANMEAGRAEQQAEDFARHVNQLRAAGCQAAAFTSMHQRTQGDINAPDHRRRSCP